MERTGELAHGREIQTLKIARHVLQHGCLVLQRLDLVVDLLQRARRRQHVLRIIGWIEHDKGVGRLHIVGHWLGDQGNGDQAGEKTASNHEDCSMSG